MSDIKKQLIRLGSEKPELQQDIRPILDHLSGKVASSDQGTASMRMYISLFMGQILVSLAESFSARRTLQVRGSGGGGSKQTFSFQATEALTVTGFILCEQGKLYLECNGVILLKGDLFGAWEDRDPEELGDLAARILLRKL